VRQDAGLCIPRALQDLGTVEHRPKPAPGASCSAPGERREMCTQWYRQKTQQLDAVPPPATPPALPDTGSVSEQPDAAKHARSGSPAVLPGGRREYTDGQDIPAGTSVATNAVPPLAAQPALPATVSHEEDWVMQRRCWNLGGRGAHCCSGPQ
jgi:hypothetical protein